MKIKSLYTRTLTAVVFAFLTLSLILYNSFTQHLLVWLIALFCVHEYIMIRSENKWSKGVLWIVSLIIGPMVPVMIYLGWISFAPVYPLLILSVFYQVYLFGRLFFKYPYGPGKITIATSGFLYITMPLLLLSHFLMDGSIDNILLILIVLIWVSDSFAYLTGSLFGKRKLMPSVSPGKSIEGAIGGLVFTVISSFILFKIFGNITLLEFVIIGVLVWLFGLAGDLVESHLKRNYKIKDSGKLLPGHGGFLDRFDAFIYLIPFVLLYLISSN